MKNYFYTDEADDSKIYVFSNDGKFVNMLQKVGEKYGWLSLNHCDANWSDIKFDTIQEAIESVMDEFKGHTVEKRGWNIVYQLSNTKELAEFILETQK